MVTALQQTVYELSGLVSSTRLKQALSLFLLAAGIQTGWAGNTFHLRGPDFSFSVTEPEGWTLDFGSASQIANFVMQPQGIPWREAEVFSLARFIRRTEAEQLKDLMDRESRDFLQRCPHAGIEEVDLEIKSRHRFRARSFSCSGLPYEIVAFTEVPGFFLIFILSSSRQARLESALPSFRKLLTSFSWMTPPPGATP